MKRYGKARTQLRRQLRHLSPNDRAEVEKFAAVLVDKAVMPEREWFRKHRAYLLGEE